VDTKGIGAVPEPKMNVPRSVGEVLAKYVTLEFGEAIWRALDSYKVIYSCEYLTRSNPL
jgi:hypothetical protein